MNKGYSIWELLCFIFGCTVCAILLVNVVAMMIFKIPTTAENSALRMGLIDLLKYISGAVIGIASAKVINKNSDK